MSVSVPFPPGARLGVDPKECGSRITGSSPDDIEIVEGREKPRNLLEWNACFYACLANFILEHPQRYQDIFQKIEIRYTPFTELPRKRQLAILIMRLKKLLTNDLPFANVLDTQDDPSLKGIPVDDRVITNAAYILRSRIIILKSGNTIFLNSSEKRVWNVPKATICLFLHNMHYRLVTRDMDIQNMIQLVESPFEEITQILTRIKTRRQQEFLERKRRNHTKFNWTTK